MIRPFSAILAIAALAASCFAQGTLSDNELIKANLKANQTHTWELEIKGDASDFRFAVVCKTGRLMGTLSPAKGKAIPLLPLGDKGVRAKSFSICTHDKIDEFDAAPLKPLAAGKYHIVIEGARAGQDFGPYTIQVLSPKFAAAPASAPPAKAEAPGKAETPEDVASLKKRVEDLERRLAVLEKLLVERK